MRVTLGCMALMCGGCWELSAATDPDAAPSPRAMDSDAGAPDGSTSERAGSRAMTRARAPFRGQWHDGTSLPEADVNDCVVTFPREQEYCASNTCTYSYRADTRTLIDAVYTTVFGEDGRVARIYGNIRGDAPKLWISVTFDEHGNPASSTHYTAGLTSIENIYENDRLAASVVSSPFGAPWRDIYHYDDAMNPARWTSWERDLDEDGVIDFNHDRVFDGERLHVARSQSGDLREVDVHTFMDGRISTIEQFGGGWAQPKLGSPDLLVSWDWDDSGRLLRFRSLGSGGSDTPSPLDMTEYVETYSSGCDALEQHFPWLFHEPGPNSVRARQRADDP